MRPFGHLGHLVRAPWSPRRTRDATELPPLPPMVLGFGEERGGREELALFSFSFFFFLLNPLRKTIKWGLATWRPPFRFAGPARTRVGRCTA